MKKCLIICVVLPVLLSCGAAVTKAAYAHLDAIILYELGNWFAADSEQQRTAAAKLAGHLRWHKKEVLPLYREKLGAAQTAVRKGMTEKAYLSVAEGMGEEAVRIADRVCGDGADIALTLSDAQITHFAEKCAEYDRTIEQRIAAKKKNPEQARLEYWLKTLSWFSGSFDNEQKSKIVSIVMSYDDAENDELRLKYLRQTQAGFIALLRSHKDRTAVRDYLRGWISRNPAFLPSYYRAELKKETILRARIIADVDRLVVTDVQREEGALGLQTYIDAIDAILGR